MYKIKFIKIAGFWGSYSIDAELFTDVNIIIGANGSGKTTLMSILHAVLSVDVDSLNEYEFDNVEIKLQSAKSTRTIKVAKFANTTDRFPYVLYTISREKYYVRLVSLEDNLPIQFKRRFLQETSNVRREMEKLVSITTLSVYRIKIDYERANKSKQDSAQISPVDHVLQDLIQRLTTYQLELSDKARGVAARLQKNVLTSLLFTGEDKGPKVSLEFDHSVEKKKLLDAFKRLGVSDNKVKLDINKHIEHISASLTKLSALIKDSDQQQDFDLDFISPLERFKQTNHVVSLSLEAEKEEKEIFKQRDDFLKILRAFITDKDFQFKNGSLTVLKGEEVPIFKLSSGEKQLIILLAEALLQREEQAIYIADEPELSLHVSWQREIVPAIRKLNPNAQIVVATHSPEIAGKYAAKLLNMEDLRS